MNNTIVNAILIELGYLIAPFETFDDKQQVVHVLNEIGFTIDSSKLEVDFKALKTGINDVKAILEDLDELDEVEGIVKKTKQLSQKLKPAIKEINKVLPILQDAVEEVLDAQADAKVFINDLPRRLIDYFIFIYLEEYHPKFFSILHLNGILEQIIDEKDVSIRRVFWERIFGLFSHPHKNFDTVYNWNSNFNGDEFLIRLANLLPHFHINGDLYVQNPELSQQLGFTEGDREELRIPLFEKGVFPDTYASISINLTQIPKEIELLVDIEHLRSFEEQGEPFHPEDFINDLEDEEFVIHQKAGFFLYPYVFGNLDFNEQLNETWNLKINGNLDLGTGFGIEIRPKEKIKIKTNLFSPDLKEIINSSLNVKLIKSEPEDSFVTIHGQPKGDGVFIGYKDFGLNFSIGGKNGDYYLVNELNLNQFTISLDTSKGDSFIKKILTNVKLESITNLGIGFSSDEGFYFKGSSGLSCFIAIHKQIGPLFLKEFALNILINDHIIFKLKSSFEIELGPLLISINQIGTQLNVGFPEDRSGDFGPIQVGDFGFISPNQIGLKVNGQAITGSGFLSSDPTNHRYAGILALQLQTIDLTAIGLITTRLPNNKKGFSMLISVSTFFNPPIELSFGFNIVAVGGLLGLNRTMNVEALRQKVLNGSIDSVMFPKDVIKNANRIISDLRTIFPPKDKHFVIAPFLRIGWGTGKLVEVDVAILLEFPFKGRVILLGSVGVYLPTKEKPISQLNIDVIGDFNIAAEYIQVEGRLRKGSHIATIALSGGFAFVLSWDKRPQFLFSVGGYHPRYKKPARFPEIPRLTAIIQKGDKLTLTCACYQAITSNSFQVGFRADLMLRYKKATIEGFFSFDTLIYFDPFYFEAEINLGVLVRYKKKKLAGIELSFLLSGPRPWTVKGFAKIKIAFIKFKIKFKLTWGARQKAAPKILQPNILLEKLGQELSSIDSWAAKMPAHLSSGELLRTIDEANNVVLLHPAGYLEVRQTVVPLNHQIKKYGTALLEGQPTFVIHRIDIGETNVLKNTSRQALKEYFARGQYEELSNNEKISTPDFELFEAGYILQQVEDINVGDAIEEVHAGYEDILVDDDIERINANDENKPATPRTRNVNPTTDTIDWTSHRFLRNKSGRIQRFKEQPKQAFQLFDTPPSFSEAEHYFIVSNLDLAKKYKDLFFESFADAENYMTKHKLSKETYLILSESQLEEQKAA